MLEVTFQNVLEDGIEEQGFNLRDFEKATTTKKIKASLEADRKAGRIYFIDHFTDELDVKDYQLYVDQWRDLDTVVVVGVGAAVAGTKALFQALTHPLHNDNEALRKKAKRLFFLDTIDPDYTIGLLEALELETTGFIVISDKGDDPDTLCLLGLIRDKVGPESLQEHIMFICGSETGPMRDLAFTEGYTEITVPEELNKRYYIISPAIYIPLLFAGVDIKKIYTGAKRAARSYRLINFQNPAVLFAAILYEFITAERIRNIVFLPFQERLSGLGDWLKILWGETLNDSGKGLTPEFFCGTRGYHNQLQHYLTGWPDKVFIALSSKKFQRRAVIRNYFDNVDEIGYIDGQELGEVSFHQESVAHALLRQHKMPSMQITHADLMEEGLAELVVFFEYVTLFLSYLLDLDFNAADEIKDGDNYMYGLLGRDGFKKEKTAFARLNTVFEKFKIRK